MKIKLFLKFNKMSSKEAYEKESEYLKNQLNNFNRAIAMTRKSNDLKERERLMHGRDVFVNNSLKKRRPNWTVTDRYAIIIEKEKAPSKPKTAKPKTKKATKSKAKKEINFSSETSKRKKELYDIIKDLDNKLQIALNGYDVDLVDRLANEKLSYEKMAKELDPNWGLSHEKKEFTLNRRLHKGVPYLASNENYILKHQNKQNNKIAKLITKRVRNDPLYAPSRRGRYINTLKK